MTSTPPHPRTDTDTGVDSSRDATTVDVTAGTAPQGADVSGATREAASVYAAVQDAHPGYLDSLEARTRRREAGPRAVAPACAENGDGPPLVGLVYRTDYRAEEEWGVTKLRTALTGENPRNFAQIPDADGKVAVFSDVNGFVLATDNLTTEVEVPTEYPDTVCRRMMPLGREVPWLTPLRLGDRHLPTPRHAAHFENTYLWVQGVRDPIVDGRPRPLSWCTMATLRDIARPLGIKPLPRRKDDLIAAIVAHREYAPDRDHPDAWPADFHYGDNLVIRADTGPTATIVARLREAIDAGTLGIGNASGPFSGGVFLYDTRDEHPSLVTAREAAFDLYDEQMEPIPALRQELEGAGFRVHCVDNPTVLDPGKGEKSLHYWLNISAARPRRGSRNQWHGWYTLTELRNHAFLEESRYTS